MNIIGKHIDVLDLGHQPLEQWKGVLEKFSHIFSDSGDIKDYGYDHNQVAFFTFVIEGEFTNNTRLPYDEHKGFACVTLPNDILVDGQFNTLIENHAAFHRQKYGSGMTMKMGLYDFKSGGSVPFHIDGPVVTKDSPLDLENEVHRKQLERMHQTHRTLLVLSCNEDDVLSVVDKTYKIYEGMFFELNNVLPHAFKNNGPKNTIFLVTTYESESEKF